MKDRSGSRLTINNEIVPFMANSLTAPEGFGENQVHVQEMGGGEVDIVVTTDLSTKIGKVTFDLKSTVENKERLRAWKANFDQNLIKITDRFGNTDVFERMTVTNDPEWALSADGVASIEFQGKSAK